jgi:hypothetical protein
MPTQEQCRRELETLHAFFVDWYAGTVGPGAFDRMEQVIAPGFEMVTPEGQRLDRAGVLEWVRDSRGQYESGEFDIEISNVDVVAAFDDRLLVRYEEWQRQSDGENGRVSTVLFDRAEDTPEGVRWLDVHETYIDS